MPTERMASPITYSYDPLNRLTASANGLRFYQREHWALDLNGATRQRVLRVDQQLLATQPESGPAQLLATDLPGSVLHATDGAHSIQQAFTPFGFHQPTEMAQGLPGFHGEARDPATGHYPLGMGYRSLNSQTMRFNSPDNLSPFGRGGLNAYASHQNDPVNNVDRDGHAVFRALLRVFGVGSKTVKSKVAAKIPKFLKKSRSGNSRLHKVTPDDLNNIEITLNDRISTVIASRDAHLDQYDPFSLREFHAEELRIQNALYEYDDALMYARSNGALMTNASKRMFSKNAKEVLEIRDSRVRHERAMFEMQFYKPPKEKVGRTKEEKRAYWEYKG